MLHLILAAMAATATPDPYQLFSRARAYWDGQRYPQLVDYDTVVDVRDTRGERVERYASAYDARAGKVWVDPVSDYERAHPASGRGVGFNLSGAAQPAPDQDFIGVPKLAPNYSFTIGRFVPFSSVQPDADVVRQVRDEFHDPNPHPATAMSSGLKEITAVVAYRHTYDIAYAGDEVVDGVDTYHLRLAPLHVDGRYRLRDLWIDRATYATVRARTVSNFVDGPGTGIPWTIDFSDVDGARYIASESADARYKYGGRSYDSVDIRFENIRVRATQLPFQPVPFSAFLILVEPSL